MDEKKNFVSFFEETWKQWQYQENSRTDHDEKAQAHISDAMLKNMIESLWKWDNIDYKQH